jgi:hypothetical protein
MQPGSEPLHLELLDRAASGTEQSLVSGDTTLTTTAPTMFGTQQLVLHARAIDARCGDTLVLRITHPSGTQPLIGVILTLDIP